MVANQNQYGRWSQDRTHRRRAVSNRMSVYRQICPYRQMCLRVQWTLILNIGTFLEGGWLSLMFSRHWSWLQSRWCGWVSSCRHFLLLCYKVPSPRTRIRIFLRVMLKNIIIIPNIQLYEIKLIISSQDNIILSNQYSH